MAVNLKLKPGQMMKVRSAVRKRMGTGLPVKVHLDSGSDHVNAEVKGAGFSSTMKKIGKVVAPLGKSAAKFVLPIAEKAAQKAIMSAVGGAAKKGRKKAVRKRRGGMIHVGGSMLPVRGV